VAFVYNSAGKKFGLSSSDDITVAYTAGANSKLVVLAICGVQNGVAGRGDDPPTYNGNNMAQVDESRSSQEGFTEMWYYLSPDAEVERNIIIPNVSTYSIRYTIVDFINASADASYFGGSGASDGSGADVPATLADVPDGSVCVSCMVHGEKDVFASITTGITLSENPPGTPVPRSGNSYLRQRRNVGRLQLDNGCVGGSWFQLK